MRRAAVVLGLVLTFWSGTAVAAPACDPGGPVTNVWPPVPCPVFHTEITREPIRPLWQVDRPRFG